MQGSYATPMEGFAFENQFHLDLLEGNLSGLSSTNYAKLDVWNHHHWKHWTFLTLDEQWFQHSTCAVISLSTASKSVWGRKWQSLFKPHEANLLQNSGKQQNGFSHNLTFGPMQKPEEKRQWQSEASFWKTFRLDNRTEPLINSLQKSSAVSQHSARKPLWLFSCVFLLKHPTPSHDSTANGYICSVRVSVHAPRRCQTNTLMPILILWVWSNCQRTHWGVFYALYYLLRASFVFQVEKRSNDITHSQSNYDSGIYLEGIRYFMKKTSSQNA